MSRDVQGVAATPGRWLLCVGPVGLPAEQTTDYPDRAAAHRALVELAAEAATRGRRIARCVQDGRLHDIGDGGQWSCWVEERRP